jgi:hypothetical protein
MENKANLLAVPITLAFVALGTIILAILKFGWVYFLIGALVGLMNHGLMLKQSYRITRYAELDPEGKTLNPKKTALIWYLMRVLVFVAVFVALVFKADVANDKMGIWYVVLALGGYLLCRIIFIIFLIIGRKKVDKE